MKRISGLSALALIVSLGACSSAEQPAAEASPAAGMRLAGPFAQSEMDMDTAMKNAVGVDAADTWVRKMIAHHEGAIEMSRVVLGLDPAPDVARMAQMTIDMQGAEIEALKALAKTGPADTRSAALYESASKTMHQEMMAASGATDSDAYLAKMLAHHRGAVAMSNIALANGATGAVRAQIEETRAEQQKEVEMVEAMQRGEPMSMATGAPPARTAQTAARVSARDAPAQPARPPAAAPKAAAATSAAASAPAASSTCAPEHRAAGHC